jgi:hypothetical protein
MYDKFCYQSSQYTITCLSQFDCTHLQIDRTDHIGVHIIPASLVIPAQAVIHLPATFGRPRRGETRNLLVRSQYVILPALLFYAVYFFIPALLSFPRTRESACQHPLPYHPCLSFPPSLSFPRKRNPFVSIHFIPASLIIPTLLTIPSLFVIPAQAVIHLSASFSFPPRLSFLPCLPYPPCLSFPRKRESIYLHLSPALGTGKRTTRKDEQSYFFKIIAPPAAARLSSVRGNAQPGFLPIPPI